MLAEPEGSQVLVQLGAMKMRVALDNLRLEAKKEQPAAKKAKQHTTVVSSKGAASRKASTEIDLRGCTVDEGISVIEQFLSSSMLSGFETVTLIHGKGTGALRKGVHEYLRRSKYVKSFRLGVFGEGEDGVTIVTLR